MKKSYKDLGKAVDPSHEGEPQGSADVKLSQQITELTNDLQRTRADFENFRKQVDLQKANDRKATKLATVYKALPLLDDIDRAISTYAELAPLTKSLEKTLKDLSLSKINSVQGTEFNPDIHDAVMVEGDGDKEIIAETLRPGYYYEGEVLRPAMVRVSKM
ncbi:MAG: nucleotide exchange factor GrpE [Candidatus Saccharimonadaceae bacterium]|nr:nucleotide exchange factor GrpE [Candidatus Saccharimonadaceae bacterium]